MNAIEITAFTSDTGPLTKRISLAPDGSLVSDGSACIMSRGTARRLRFDGFADFARHIGNLKSNEAIALGALRSDLCDEVHVVTKTTLTELNGHAPSTMIARTAGHINYHPEKSAAVLLDYDTKGMPHDVKSRVDAAGGFWPSLLFVAPDLERAERVHRASTSSGIVRSDTGEDIAGSSGIHVFLHVRDGGDTERFLRALHDRCWLHGLGWMMVGGAGQILERSIIDRMVFAGERLVFEGAPVLKEPLAQDAADRAPVLKEGEPVDTLVACRVLNMIEVSRLRELKEKAKAQIDGDARRVKTQFVKEQAATIVSRGGITQAHAQRIVEMWCKGVLLPSVALAFDADEFSGCTVRDVLADPDRFEGATLADPLEGVAYGRAKAKVLCRQDGTPWINSFAHGRSVYDLKYDAATVEDKIKAGDLIEAPSILAGMQHRSDLTADELQRLKAFVMERSKVSARPLNEMLKESSKEYRRERAQSAQSENFAKRIDNRVLLDVPHIDDERVPVVEALDAVFCAVAELEPPMRSVEGEPVEVLERAPFMLHELTSGGSNSDEPGKTQLPAPPMPLITLHDECSYAQLIECHVEYVKRDEKTGARTVVLPDVFVRHHMRYRGSQMPRVGAVVTAPLVLPDGKLLALNGLDRNRKMVFRIQPEMLAVLPKPHDPKPTDRHVVEAMKFLTDEWLFDVRTDFAGKCVLIALAMIIIERTLFAERPIFFVTAGKRGGGKTTALAMILLAATGRKPAAAAWSSAPEERRKAILGYLSEGIPALVFDNIPTGSRITCPSLEKAATAETYQDRILGETRTISVPAFTIMTLTGNNIGPTGDLSSRSLVTRLDVEQADPENRAFKHVDPIAWTNRNRGKILRALYTIMLANPQLKDNKPPETRVKRWWHMVGSSVENAAQLMKGHQDTQKQADGLARTKGQKSELSDGLQEPPMATAIRFKDMFASVEADDDDTAGQADLLSILEKKWCSKGKQSADLFTAKDIADLINVLPLEPGTPPNAQALAAYELARTLRPFFDPEGRSGAGKISAITVGVRLKAMVDCPQLVDGWTLMIKKPQTEDQAKQRRIGSYRIWSKKDEASQDETSQ